MTENGLKFVVTVKHAMTIADEFKGRKCARRLVENDLQRLVRVLGNLLTVGSS